MTCACLHDDLFHDGLSVFTWSPLHVHLMTCACILVDLCMFTWWLVHVYMMTCFMMAWACLHEALCMFTWWLVHVHLMTCACLHEALCMFTWWLVHVYTSPLHDYMITCACLHDDLCMCKWSLVHIYMNQANLHHDRCTKPYALLPDDINTWLHKVLGKFTLEFPHRGQRVTNCRNLCTSCTCT